VFAGSACRRAQPPSAAAYDVKPSAAPRVLSSYRAPLGCPTQPEYLQEVERRSATLRLSPESPGVEGSDRVRVRIRPDTSSAGWVGVLEIEGAHPLEREVRGERCQDVALALALITVLRLESQVPESAAAGAVATLPPHEATPGAPVAGSTPAERGASGVITSERSPAVAVTPPPVGAATPPAAATPPPAAVPSAVAAKDSASTLTPDMPLPADVPAPPTAAPPDAPALPPETSALLVPASPDAAELSAGSGEASLGAASELDGNADAALQDRATEVVASTDSGASRQYLFPGVAAYVGYASAPSQALQASLQLELQLGPGVQSWAAALALTYSAAEQANSAAELGFRLLAAELALCAPGGEWAGLRLRGCAELGLGSLRVSVAARDPSLETRATSRSWVALGPSLQAALPLASHWSLRAIVATSFLLVRDQLEVERVVGGEPDQPDRSDRSTLYQPPLAAFELLLGAGYAF
jgi:hypothetical protein